MGNKQTILGDGHTKVHRKIFDLGDHHLHYVPAPTPPATGKHQDIPAHILPNRYVVQPKVDKLSDEKNEINQRLLFYGRPVDSTKISYISPVPARQFIAAHGYIPVTIQSTAAKRPATGDSRPFTGESRPGTGSPPRTARSELTTASGHPPRGDFLGLEEEDEELGALERERHANPDLRASSDLNDIDKILDAATADTTALSTGIPPPIDVDNLGLDETTHFAPLTGMSEGSSLLGSDEDGDRLHFPPPPELQPLPDDGAGGAVLPPPMTPLAEVGDGDEEIPQPSPATGGGGIPREEALAASDQDPDQVPASDAPVPDPDPASASDPAPLPDPAPVLDSTPDEGAS